MHEIANAAANLDIAQLVILIGAMWVFYKRIDKKFDLVDKKFDLIDKRFENLNEKVDSKFENLNEKVDSKLENLNENIKELRTSLNRMEGAFYSKECCMLKDERQIKKVD